MNKFQFISTCFLLFLMSFSSVVGYRFLQTKIFQKNPQGISPEVQSNGEESPLFTPVPLEYENIPPKQSLSGKVTLLQGEVRKFSRDATESAILNQTDSVLEAEEIIASESATTKISFGTADTVTVEPETTLSFVSTNPHNFLTTLSTGSVAFETDETVATISARTLHGLFEVSQGKAQLTTDPDKKIITFSIVSGSGKVGYIDKNNKTQTVDLEPGILFTFDDTKRKYTAKPL